MMIMYLDLWDDGIVNIVVALLLLLLFVQLSLCKC
jgi:hypothetical protein